MCNELRTNEQAGNDAGIGDLGHLFVEHGQRLRRMVRVRMDPRLCGRIDPSDVIQETYMEAHRRKDELARSSMPPFLWLRRLAGQKLVDLHRFHLGAQRRSAGREVSLFRGPLPEATSASIAAQLLGRLTSASDAAMRDEIRARVEQALAELGVLDREVLALRHFDGLTNAETALELGVSPNAASNRYVRALRRVKELLPNLGSL